MEFNCGIYKWRNIITGKNYIGQSRNLLDRKEAFFNFSNYKYAGRKINEARQKYKDPYYWEYEILVYCSPEALDDQEIKYIKLYDSITKGYNIKTGGTSKIVIDHCKPFYPYMDFNNKAKFLIDIGKNISHF